MNLNQIRYFCRLAEEEHYTKAAGKLNISQPTLSHAVACLEEELGAPLFVKQGRGVVLTKYGKLFRDYAEESLRILDTGVRKVQSLTGQTEGVIELAYIYTLGTSFVPQIVRDFIRANEELNVQFHFTVGNTSEIIQGLKEERFDVGFCSMPEQEEEIEFTAVGTENLVAVVPKGHPLSVRTSVDLEQTAAYPQIFYTKSSGLRPMIERLFRQAKIHPQIVCEIEEDGAMAGLIAQGFGIAVMPEIPILNQLEVDVLQLKNLEQKRYVYMARPKGKYQPPVAEHFSRYVKRSRG